MRGVKKGQSQVLTTILIILLILAAIVIVWNVVNSLVNKASSEISDENILLVSATVRKDHVFIDEGQDRLQLDLKRNSFNVDIAGFKLIVSGDGSKSYTMENYPGVSELKRYNINLDGLENVKKVEIYPKSQSGGFGPKTEYILKEGDVAVGHTFEGIEISPEGDSGGEGGGGGGQTCSDNDNDGFDDCSVAQGGDGNDEVDCDDGDDQIWEIINSYNDLDGDGFGSGSLVGHCSDGNIPPGNSSEGSDCDDSDNSIWQLIAGYVDGDSDNYGSGGQVNVCSGATLNTANHADNNLDCNDGDNVINPGAAEVCGQTSVDYNCNGFAGDNDAACLISGLTGWWPLNGSANDLSGNGRDGIILGGVSFVSDGERGEVGDFNGNGFIHFEYTPGDGSVENPIGNFIDADKGTISTWIKPRSNPNGGNPWVDAAVVQDQGGYVGIHVDSNLQFYNWDGSAKKVDVSYTANEWYHVVWVHDNGQIKGYVNGNLEGAVNTGNTLSVATDLEIGGEIYYLDGRRSLVNFDGRINEVMIWERALTATDVQNLYDLQNHN